MAAACLAPPGPAAAGFRVQSGIVTYRDRDTLDGGVPAGCHGGAPAERRAGPMSRRKARLVTGHVVQIQWYCPSDLPGAAVVAAPRGSAPGPAGPDPGPAAAQAQLGVPRARHRHPMYGRRGR